TRSNRDWSSDVCSSDLGHAYTTTDGSGDVYFDVTSFPPYGELSNQRIDQVAESADPGRDKRDPRDFALWKGAKPGEPSWDTPWRSEERRVGKETKPRTG